jgi:outer membrane receptor protein involved in Fe transport
MVIALLGATTAGAQEESDGEGSVPAVEAPVMDDIVVVGRLKSNATDVLAERLDNPVAADFLDAGQISRVGDSSVSLALRRLPGVTLVNDQFVYVRGLGERYSSTTLNGSFVPSPDLSRSVIPLDLFPATIIDSLAVQKGYTSDRPAAFGGGNIDIRLRNIPEEGLFYVEVGSGWDSESSDKGLKYTGGDDDWLGTDDGTRSLPGAIKQAIPATRGDVSASGIFQALQREGLNPTFDEAEALNRQLATSLNRDVNIRSRDLDPDIAIEGAVGNSWYLGDSEQWRIGGLALVDYGNRWRNRNRTQRAARTSGDEVFQQDIQRTINQVTLTGSLNAGIEYGSDHELRASYLYLRNTEDEASVSRGNNQNFEVENGTLFRNYAIRYEERELSTVQISGSHTLGAETLDLLKGFIDLRFAEELTFDWFYSDSDAESDIPGELSVNAVDSVEPQTGNLISTSVRQSLSAADYRFTDLEDDVESYGWNLTYPFETENFFVETKVGGSQFEKGRQLEQLRFGLGTTTTAANPILVGEPADVFTDENILNPDNGFSFSDFLIGTESYLAAEKISGVFGQIDATWRDTWRVNAGVRWEEFQQISIPYDPLNFTGGSKVLVPLNSQEDLESFATIEDDFYPSVAVTWMRPDFLGAQDFQLRFGWSQTIARPDLREVTPATYIDPVTEAIVRGRSGLQTSELGNFDIRAEWFFASGDNFTTSLFFKDIDTPIETIQDACSPEDLCFTFVNGESAEVYGVEIEWFKQLGFLEGALGGWTDYFFFSGNLTLSDSEIDFGDVAEQQNLTSAKRRLTQHSKFVTNLQLGFDSPSEKHAATLVFNTFSERLFFGAIGAGSSDAYEQPFNSLDFIYSYYPTSFMTLRLRLQNLLDDNTEIEQSGVTIFEQEIGTTARLDLRVQF